MRNKVTSIVFSIILLILMIGLLFRDETPMPKVEKTATIQETDRGVLVYHP